MLIFAHRGMKNEMPENTMPAFKEAFSRGFGIEFDVRMTADKHIVIIHDKDLKRITGGLGEVSSMTLAELDRLDFGGHFSSQFKGVRIPTIEEVCRLIASDLPAGQKAALHLKYEEQTEEMLTLISQIFDEYFLYQKAFIFDLTLSGAKNFKEINGKIDLAVSIGEDNYSPTIYQWQKIVDSLNDFSYVWLDEWRVKGSVLNKTFIDGVRKSGKAIHAISPELHKKHGHPLSEMGYEDVWKKLNAWGVDGICTAYPDKLEQVLMPQPTY